MDSSSASKEWDDWSHDMQSRGYKYGADSKGTYYKDSLGFKHRFHPKQVKPTPPQENDNVVPYDETNYNPYRRKVEDWKDYADGKQPVSIGESYDYVGTGNTKWFNPVANKSDALASVPIVTDKQKELALKSKKEVLQGSYSVTKKINDDSPGFKTIFIEKISGAYLGEMKHYEDNESPLNITFPKLKINIRSIPNQDRVYKNNKYETDYTFNNDPRTNKENARLNNVSASIAVKWDDYQKTFNDIIAKNEAGEKKEQSAVIIYDGGTAINAIALPDNINRVVPPSKGNGNKGYASFDAFIACYWPMPGFEANYLLPNDDPGIYNKYYTNAGIAPEDMFSIPDNFPQTLWGLAMFVYQMRNAELYGIVVTDKQKQTADKYYKDAFKEIALDFGTAIITVSHTHPHFSPKREFETHFVMKSEEKITQSHSTEDLKMAANDNRLPDLIITFNDNNRVNKMEVLDKSAKTADDVKVVARSKTEFINKRDEILYDNLMRKYEGNK